MKPPIAGRQLYRPMSLFIELSADGRSASHAFFQEIIEAFACPWFSKKLMPNSDQIDRINIDGDIQSDTFSVQWSLDNDLQSC